MQQQPRSPSGRVSPPGAGGSARAGARVKALSAVLGVVVLAALVIYGPGLLPEDRTVPTHLLGTWETEYASHAEHPMQFAVDTLRFHTEEGWMGYRIVRVGSRAEDSRTWYQFDYLVEGEEFEMTLYYYATPDEHVRFENQPHLVWRKVEGEGS